MEDQKKIRNQMTCLKTHQKSDQPVNVTHWRRDEEFAQYPEGARDKSLLYCPPLKPYDFLKTNHRYLFKLSSSRGCEQFWMEIFAYRLGVKMGVPVPPAFIAHDENHNHCGALIEWFYDTASEDYTAGGDYCQQRLPEFDRKKGAQHNFETISHIFQELQIPNWTIYWSKAFVFDALIGNTDRHQDNWGIIEKVEYVEQKRTVIKTTISPVFDNGTSMGYEVTAPKFHHYDNHDHLLRYISKGKHHIRWSLQDPSPLGHSEMIRKMANVYPETREIMIACLRQVSCDTFKELLDDLVAFDLPVKLTTERSEFMLKLLKLRHHRLLNELETNHAIY